MNIGAKVSKQQCEDIALKACHFRDAAIAAYREVETDPDLQEQGCDPGDAHIDINGNPWNVLTVLNLLRQLGVPGCET